MDAMAEPPRILVVDDDPAMRLLCRRILQEVSPPGVQVDEAASAEEAIRLVRAHPYHVVLSDHYMAWMTGVDLLEITLREQPRCLRLLMTGRAQMSLVQEALSRARIDGFIPKPPQPEEMRKRLLGLLAARN